MKVKIEIVSHEGGTWFNYWDWKHGNDVVAELIDGQLVIDSEVVTIDRFIEKVKERVEAD